ncbi:MAG: hypothetical protein ACKOA8_10165, partial [Deltaproteobacteria bacterium]
MKRWESQSKLFWGIIALTLLGFPSHSFSSEPETLFEFHLSDSKEPSEISIEEKDATNENFTLQIRGLRNFEFSTKELKHDDLVSFNSLEDKQKKNFLTNRELLLASLGKLLIVLKKPIGFTKKFGAKLSSAKTEEAKERKRTLAAQTLEETGLDSVTQLLKAFDRELWVHAPFISQVNEIGASVEAGIAGGAKLGKRGVFVILGTGVSLGIDPKEKAVIFELFQDVEWSKTALPGYIGAEAFGSLFGNTTYHDWKNPLQIEKGNAIGAPGLAGCITSNNARVGIAKGIGLGFPGAAVMTSTLVRIPLVRIGISPEWPQWVRAKVLG